MTENKDIERPQEKARSCGSAVERIVMWFKALFFRPIYYNKDGSPKLCWHCDSSEISYLTKSTVANVEAEFSCECKACGKIIGYWAYGYYDPSFKKDIFYT